MHSPIVVPITLALLAASSLAACGSSGSSSAGSSGGAPDGSITVGYSTYTLSNPFFAGMSKGLESGATKNGFKLVTTNANGDPAQQVTDIQNLVARGVKYILLTPADGKAIGPAIAAADAAKIPVISIADGVQPPITSTIRVDDPKAGALAATEIVAYLKKTNGSEKGNVADIQGLAGTPAASGREQGFADEMAKYPNVKIVSRQDGGFDTQKANTVMSDVLQANPQIDAVFAANDAMAVGASAAIKSQNRFKPVGEPGHIFMVGVDGSKPAIEDVRNGVQDVSISQNPIKMAEKAMDTVAQLQSGAAVESEIAWPAQPITKENINSAEVKDYGIWADEVS